MMRFGVIMEGHEYIKHIILDNSRVNCAKQNNELEKNGIYILKMLVKSRNKGIVERKCSRLAVMMPITGSCFRIVSSACSPAWIGTSS